MSGPGERRCPRCECPDSATQCDHCKVCPHADGTSSQEPAKATPLEEAQATIESLRYQIRRAREALATDDGNAEAAVARARALHVNEYGSCSHCTRADSIPYPCPTIRALDGETP